jgi:P-type Ca2+ transporter type 2C
MNLRVAARPSLVSAVLPSPPEAKGAPWHESASDACKRLGVNPRTGLDPLEAARRLTRGGPNTLPAPQHRSLARMMVGQLTEFMVLLLLASAVVAGLLGELQDIAAIVAIVVLNAALGVVQEYRAERALAALRALAAPRAWVRRGGELGPVPAVDLVRGDVVALEAGNVVPADLRLLETAGLRLDEATLTGESHPVDKSPAPLPDVELPLGERHNMAYKGTVVTAGRGLGAVVATGTATELGRIASMLRRDRPVRTPLQRRLAQLGQRLSVAVFALCAVIFGVGLLAGEQPGRMLLTAVSLAVAALPEALPAVVTISLALGARRMARRHALIRRLPAVEALGSVTHICADKTGTLTVNRMRVDTLYVDGRIAPGNAAGPDREPWSSLFTALAVSNDARWVPPRSPEGDPTEIALLVAAAHAGREKAVLEARLPRIGELPFASERGKMTTLHRREGEGEGEGEGDVIVFTKGAPEAVLPGCVNRVSEGGPVPLEPAAILAAAEQMARRGDRVLAVACRRLAAPPEAVSSALVETDQSFLGLVGLQDPPRAEAKAAVADCQSAGIRVIMITGDHPATARAIAEELGIMESAESVMTGPELTRLPMDEFERRVRDIRVYARAAPEQKIKIVAALRDQGEAVAMTGDGVNDAPALQLADIGVAMGARGADVAREAADMVLLDDNFATIVGAVREGRRIYDNLRKFVRYTLTSGVGELWPLLLAPFLGLPAPLLPIHILWVNLVTDGLPGLALAAEPAERDIMERPPRRPDESFFGRGLWQHVVWVGLLMGSVTLATVVLQDHGRPIHWQSMAFTVLALSQMGHVLAVRSDRESFFAGRLWSNPFLLGAVALTLALQLGTLYVPVANAILRTEPLTAVELATTLALSSVVFIAVEIEKLVKRRVQRSRV